MLQELSITNLAIIDHLRLAFEPGMNVLTGETGAGKSIIVDAVSALLGERMSGETMIRAGAERATIEGLFGLRAEVASEVAALLREYGLDDGDGTLILSRELNRSGRNTCRVNGRPVTLGVLQEFGQRLIDIHGQGEHLSLLRVREHLLFLDRYASLTEQRSQVAAIVAELRQVREALQTSLRDEREIARRVDLLQFQVAEIEAARLAPDEEEDLLRQRTLLANAERLSELANVSYTLLNGGEQRRAALDILGAAARDLEQLERLDPAVAEHRQTVENAIYQLEDVARALRLYRDAIEYSPARLQQVEERLSTIQSLKRKYGDTIADVIEFGRRAADELEAISHSEERVAELREQEQALRRRAGEEAGRLSRARAEAARALEQAVEEQLAELQMEGARFIVSMARSEDPAGPEVDGRRCALESTGIDRVEFLVGPNPGEPPKPMAKIASGGETSRLMLALKCVLSAADPVPCLIFDEIDAGISGRVGTLVGRKLWSLTPEHQVLCVTHLPHIAGFADHHLNVSKRVDGERTVTVVRSLRDGERPQELASLLGAEGGQAALLSAEELLGQVEGWKQRERSPS
jgi:DNA repair protein RecN (Recombination protein N)